MGARQILGLSDTGLRDRVRAALGGSDKQRRSVFRRRRDFYRACISGHVKSLVDEVFSSPEVRRSVKQYARFSEATALYQQVIGDISRPVYQLPPSRVIEPAAGQKPWAAVVQEVGLNRRLDLAVHYVNACNHALAYARYVPSLGPDGRLVLDVLTPDQFTVITHPDAPTHEIAVVYDKRVGDDMHRVYWDDEMTFELDASLHDITGFRPHGLARRPMMVVHRTERLGDEYWDLDSGRDLVSAQETVSLLNMLVVKLHKSQGEKQLAFQGGDLGAVERQQVLDSETAIHCPEGSSVAVLELQASPEHYGSTIEGTTKRAGAAHGLSRERLNAKGGQTASDERLAERRQDIVKVFVEAEQEIFEILKMVSREHADPRKRIPENARLRRLDFGELQERTSIDRRIDTWDKMEQRGLLSWFDVIMQLNPEIKNIEAAKREYQSNLEARAWRIDMQRRLTMPADGSPGRSPEENGALGGRPTKREDGEESDDSDADPGRG